MKKMQMSYLAIASMTKMMTEYLVNEAVAERET